MGRILSTLAATAVAGAVTTAAAPEALAGVEVVEFAWAARVVERNAEHRYQDRAPAGAPLYLWIRLRGDDDALDRLRDGGKLPIRHEWVNYVGPDPDIDTLRPTDEIEVGGVREAVVDQVASEVALRGYFDWRTWSVKRNLRLGTHAVKVVYADGSPVPCQIADRAPEPCVFRIRVAR